MNPELPEMKENDKVKFKFLLGSREAEHPVPPQAFVSRMSSIGVDKALHIQFTVGRRPVLCERGINSRTAEPQQPGGVRQVPLKGASHLIQKFAVKLPN